MTLKVTMLFQSATEPYDAAAGRTGGWSESWYSSKAYPSSDFNTAFEELLASRAALLPSRSSIIGQRIQSVENQLLARTLDIKYPGAAALQGDLPQHALLVNVRAAGGSNHRAVMLRGTPDARVEGGEYKPSAAYNQSLIRFFAEIRNNWLMKGRVRTNPLLKLMSIDATGLATTKAIHALAPNDEVRLHRCYDQYGRSVKGTAIVATTPTTRTATLVGNPDLLGNVIVRGSIRKDASEFFQVTVLDAEVLDPLATLRKVGRPFQAFHGRR